MSFQIAPSRGLKVMKILLVYPEFPDTFWSFKHALKFIRKRAALPPLGLFTVAAMLPENWNKRLVDVNVRALRDKDLAWADVVMIMWTCYRRPRLVPMAVTLSIYGFHFRKCCAGLSV